MAISLEELRRQREQIQKHLDWLDAKIREQEPVGEQPKPLVEKAETVAAKPELIKAPKEAATETPNASTETEEVTVPKVEIEGQVYQSKTQDDLLHAKVGCFLFFVLAIVLFIFLLFGLPYYL